MYSNCITNGQGLSIRALRFWTRDGQRPVDNTAWTAAFWTGFNLTSGH